ncbi:ABC transporter [Ceratobasidium sp. AG-Ba]|nr:ABC transporter [Ceratobasidium sp. AG-Ba]
MFKLPALASGVVSASIAISLVVLFLTRPKRIRLPVSGLSLSHNENDNPLHDPFDDAKPEEVIDGNCLDEDEFWNLVRRRKIAQNVVLAIGFALAAFQIIWICWDHSNRKDSVGILSFGVQVALLGYLAILSSVSTNTTDVPIHWSYVIHISTLSTIAFTVYLAAEIIPAEARLETVMNNSVLDLTVHYGVVASLGISAAIGIFIPRAPKVYLPPELVYQKSVLGAPATTPHDNVIHEPHASIISFLFFHYVTPIMMVACRTESLELKDLPILTARLRSPLIFSQMRRVLRIVRLPGWFHAKPGSGYELIYQILTVNKPMFLYQLAFSIVVAALYYVPAFFIKQFIHFLEITRSGDPSPEIDFRWGWVYCAVVSSQMWAFSTVKLQIPLRIQLNTMLFAKTLVRKNVVSTEPARLQGADDGTTGEGIPEPEFSSKAQVHTLMTTDVDRVSQFYIHFYALVDAPIELGIGTFLLYTLLGSSCFFGLLVAIILIPVNHYGSQFVVASQDRLMGSRDQRVALMNEILGAIRMIKFMALEKEFQEKVLRVRGSELKYQKHSYWIQVLFNAIYDTTPTVRRECFSRPLMTLASFFHFAVVRRQSLTPSIAFTALAIFNELRFALNALPETIVNLLQSVVSARRIESYMTSSEISNIQSIKETSLQSTIKLVSASISWPVPRPPSDHTLSAPSTPRTRFTIRGLTAEFPQGKLSLVCGKLGSGKSLLLSALLGEADILAGEVFAPRSPPDTLAYLNTESDMNASNWVVEGICAYVPQVTWLQNDSIQNNILFGLPLNESRYHTTLEVCALIPDLELIEDGDQAEIGERGVNLSGGQKARVSLARAIYSRASVLLLDDVLSAVDAYTAKHLFEHCLCGPLSRGRTIVLVSHHVQLILPAASYVVALDNGGVMFAGSQINFTDSPILNTVVSSSHGENLAQDANHLHTVDGQDHPSAEGTVSINAKIDPVPLDGQDLSALRPARKLIEDETRAVGRIKREIWTTYIAACGTYIYWASFLATFLGGALVPILTNGWLRYWSAQSDGSDDRSPLWFLSIYALINIGGIVMQTMRWYVLYDGSIRASTALYKRLLRAVIFASIRFHDTIHRGRVLNRFGKDFEEIDSKIADELGHTLVYALNTLAAVIAVTYVGGMMFAATVVLLAMFAYHAAKIYGQASRDLRRLDSVTRSPLYTIYGDTISGASVIRAFGASTLFLREMFHRVDTNISPYHASWSINRWIALQFSIVIDTAVTLAASKLTRLLAILLDNRISASFAGFAISVAVGITYDLFLLMRRFVGLEQSMVALERVEEYANLPSEGPEIVEPRPEDVWPENGHVQVKNLVIQYAPDLPKVLHGLSFEILAGSKIGVLGRTGSGKSTLALSFFRFVEATEGRIEIDGVDISQIGLADLRSRLTIIPQDPTILSGTIRSNLDPFGQYQDHEIFQALRRVHLLPSSNQPATEPSENLNMFQDLDASVSEGGENFSAGEKQLMCMARAILKRSKLLICDEATARFVDYVTDELISQTIREEFIDSTIITIAHRLRTVIDYDKVMVLDQGCIVEYDEPAKLLADEASKFHMLCKSSGPREFAHLKKTAEGAALKRK